MYLQKEKKKTWVPVRESSGSKVQHQESTTGTRYMTCHPFNINKNTATTFFTLKRNEK